MDWGCNDFVRRSDVLEITAETGALETQGRVKNLPAADVLPVVHGRWIDERWRRNPFGSAIPYSCDATCSACGNHGDVRIKRGDEEWEINSPRCPACVASMDDETAIARI